MPMFTVRPSSVGLGTLERSGPGETRTNQQPSAQKTRKQDERTRKLRLILSGGAISAQRSAPSLRPKPRGERKIRGRCVHLRAAPAAVLGRKSAALHWRDAISEREVSRLTACSAQLSSSLLFPDDSAPCWPDPAVASFLGLL